MPWVKVDDGLGVVGRRWPPPYVRIESRWLSSTEIDSLTDSDFRRAIFGLTRSHLNWRRAVRRREDRSRKSRRPEVFRHYKAIRRARERGALGTHTRAEWIAKIEAFGGRCAYCGAVSTELCRDHVVPIARGGTNAIENIVPACRPCNSRKGAR